MDEREGRRIIVGLRHTVLSSFPPRLPGNDSLTSWMGRAGDQRGDKSFVIGGYGESKNGLICINVTVYMQCVRQLYPILIHHLLSARKCTQHDGKFCQMGGFSISEHVGNFHGETENVCAGESFSVTADTSHKDGIYRYSRRNGCSHLFFFFFFLTENSDFSVHMSKDENKPRIWTIICCYH